MTDGGSSTSAAPSPELRRQFWALVAVLNVAVLATALGVLVLAFTARSSLGAGLVAVGLLATGYGWRRYRRVRGSGFGSE